MCTGYVHYVRSPLGDNSRQRTILRVVEPEQYYMHCLSSSISSCIMPYVLIPVQRIAASHWLHSRHRSSLIRLAHSPYKSTEAVTLYFSASFLTSKINTKSSSLAVIAYIGVLLTTMATPSNNHLVALCYEFFQVQHLRTRITIPNDPETIS